MIARRARIVLAALVASALALAGCAVPGNEAPGVAATFRGAEYDNAQVAKYEAALTELNIEASAGKALTFQVLGDPLVALAREHGFTYTDEQAASDASIWATLGDPTVLVDTSPEAKKIAAMARALEYLLSTSEQSIDDLVALIKQARIDVVASPRYGAFSDAYFTETLAQAVATYTDTSINLGPIRFALFGQVNGFPGQSATWITGE